MRDDSFLADYVTWPLYRCHWWYNVPTQDNLRAGMDFTGCNGKKNNQIGRIAINRNGYDI